jgi:hypothetical protein
MLYTGPTFPFYYGMLMLYRVIKRYLSAHLMIQYKNMAKDGHHRIHPECGPCYTEHGLGEQFGVSINVWGLAGDSLNITGNFLCCSHQVHRDVFIILYIFRELVFCVCVEHGQR